MVSLLIVQLFLCICAAAGCFEDMETLAVCCLFFCPWECVSLYKLIKNAALTRKNHERMEKELKEYPEAEFKGKNTGWICFGVMAVWVFVTNSLAIFMI